MMAKTQITLETEMQRRVRQRANDLGVSLAEYFRRLVARDLARPEIAAQVDRIFDLGSSGGSDIHMRASTDVRALTRCSCSPEAEVLLLDERAREEFRKGMQSFLHSCLAVAMGAEGEHSKVTLNVLLKGNGKTLEGPSEKSANGVESEIVPNAGSGLMAR
jgi:hypothetical protein